MVEGGALTTLPYPDNGYLTAFLFLPLFLIFFHLSSFTAPFTTTHHLFLISLSDVFFIISHSFKHHFSNIMEKGNH